MNQTFHNIEKLVLPTKMNKKKMVEKNKRVFYFSF